mmetsp:Transcript_32/g.47  ORF Transcript_32/g.47 Transcript_32/m.47 type:complete len:393 (+) Transcript_32:115-1293(+)
MGDREGFSRKNTYIQLLLFSTILAPRQFSNAFQQPFPIQSFNKGQHKEQIDTICQGLTRSSTNQYLTASQEAETQEVETLKPCYWRSPESGRWEERVRFEDLKVGQPLVGVVVQEKLNARTGAKVWLDCGVCSMNKENEFIMVNGMYRIRDRKTSVVKKKATRLRKKKSGMPVWVSRVFSENKQFEVVVNEEGIPTESSKTSMVPASSLEVQQELIGTVIRIEDYGVFLDVGANRPGLLHIKKVADVYNQYINKAKGLAEAGLEMGAKIRVSVLSNEKKRLAFDFTDDVKAEAEKMKLEENTEPVSSKLEETIEPVSSEDTPDSGSFLSEEDAAAWADFATISSSPAANISSGDNKEEASAYQSVEEDDDYFEDDDYDEDRDIEDALGLGTY